MKGHECYHCKQWVDEGTAHDCWTTTEGALTRDLPDDLKDAWERLRETAAEFGEQRIYASHHSIMFARKACYFFVRPGKNALEVCFFLGRVLRSPKVRRTDRPSSLKVSHIVHIRHRDEVEPPFTDWLREAYEVSPELSARGPRRLKPAPTSTAVVNPAPRSNTVAEPKPAGTAKGTTRTSPARSGGSGSRQSGRREGPGRSGKGARGSRGR